MMIQMAETGDHVLCSHAGLLHLVAPSLYGLDGRPLGQTVARALVTTDGGGREDWLSIRGANDLGELCALLTEDDDRIDLLPDVTVDGVERCLWIGQDWEREAPRALKSDCRLYLGGGAANGAYERWLTARFWVLADLPKVAAAEALAQRIDSRCDVPLSFGAAWAVGVAP